jgi:triosephosphate isomerase (TIM)
MRPLVAGNWKMNGLGSALPEIEAVAEMAAADAPDAEILICPPATLLSRAAQVAAGRIKIGGQDCHAEMCGAYTGDISAEMLKDAGGCAVIVGHSERRQFHGENNTLIAAKARAAWRAGLLAIICIGETETERNAGGHLGICERQLAGSVPDGAATTNTVVAYEPVWAIGTGKTATPQDIAAMHAHIRKCLVQRFGEQGRGIPILYGGSVKPSNAVEIFSLSEVSGALVGGASLKAVDFCAIIAAATMS